MIHPVEADIDREVIHRPESAGAAERRGVLSSFNDSYCYVKFKGYALPEALPRNELHWATIIHRHYGFNA